MRWFTRITPTRFDQQSIRAEAEAFADFVPLVAKRHNLDLAQTAFLGYSNGANLVSSVMLLRPGLIGRAALLRPMPVLDDVPPADLAKARVLVIAGAADATYAPFAPALVDLLRRHGAEVDAKTIPSGHEFGDEDASLVRSWLARSTISAAGCADAVNWCLARHAQRHARPPQRCQMAQARRKNQLFPFWRLDSGPAFSAALTRLPT